MQVHRRGISRRAVSTSSETNLKAKPRTDSERKASSGPRVRRTFTLRRVGFRVVPYEDGDDDREAFTGKNVVYVNKAHSAYRTEVLRGSGLLLRHVVRLVSKIIALEKYPEGREALDLQNRLIAEAIRLTQTGRTQR